MERKKKKEKEKLLQNNNAYIIQLENRIPGEWEAGFHEALGGKGSQELTARHLIYSRVGDLVLIYAA